VLDAGVRLLIVTAFSSRDVQDSGSVEHVKHAAADRRTQRL
jgi:hypothetical protein